MFSKLRTKLYLAVPSTDLEFNETPDSVHGERLPPAEKSWLRLNIVKIPSFFCAIILSIVGAFALGHFLGYHQTDSQRHHQQHIASVGSNCAKLYYRREWRSLSQRDKLNYIKAVNCLGRTPSVLRDNGTMYDDFPWAHNLVSHNVHRAAFLPWHRHLLSVYEDKLRTICGYRGAFPYWDWTLDWEDPANSPVFSTTIGFGGDGNTDSSESVGHGRCVTQGPFVNLKPMFYGKDGDRPHCLSRGFTNFSGQWDISPAAIEEILGAADYETFFLAAENGPHNTIHNTIKGDMSSFTAGYDPIFYLHHAQLDRLWYHWQRQAPNKRLIEYYGKADGSEIARLDDVLLMGGLGRDVQVSQIMDTEAAGLCYRYA